MLDISLPSCSFTFYHVFSPLFHEEHPWPCLILPLSGYCCASFPLWSKQVIFLLLQRLLPPFSHFMKGQALSCSSQSSCHHLLSILYPFLLSYHQHWYLCTHPISDQILNQLPSKSLTSFIPPTLLLAPKTLNSISQQSHWPPKLIPLCQIHHT